MKKKIVSLALSLAFVFSMIYVGFIGLATTVTATGLGAGTPLSEALKGYKRITVADINASSGYRMINQDGDGDDNLFTVKDSWTLSYAGSFGGKTYLDVDMNFNGSTGGSFAIQWQGNNWYYNSFLLYMYNSTNFVLAHYDNNKALTTIAQTLGNYGVNNTTYFNVKLLTDVQKASSDAATETVTWQLWVNDMYVNGGSFSEVAHERKILTNKPSTTNYLTMRVPKVLEEEFEGYEKISISDFHTGSGGTTSISAKPAGTELTGPNNGAGITQRYYNSATVEAASTYSLDKTYFDFDVNLASSTTAPMYALYERVNWRSYLRIKFNNASNQLLLDYVDDDAKTVTSLGTYNLVAFGRTATNEFFNLKVRADFKANASDATLRDAVIQLWINNRFATEVNLTAKDMRDGIWFRPGGETTYIRESKDMATELSGYRRVDMFDYSYNNNGGIGKGGIASDGTLSMLPADQATSYITDFDKTYLDIDVNFNGNSSWGTNYLMLLSDGATKRWHTNFLFGFNGTGTLRLQPYINQADATTGTNYTLSASEYGISVNETFNLKFRTDITHTSSTVETIHFQCWINNQFAWEGTTTFTYTTEGNHNRNIIYSGGGSGQNITICSAVDTDTQLDGYKRIVADDFDNIGATVAVGGTPYAAGVAGEYTGNTADLAMSYFDVDIKTPNGMNPFIVWLSKNKTSTGMYGDGNQLYFYLKNNTNLTLLARATSGNSEFALGDISAAPYTYTASEFFNIKIKTTVYGANSIGIAVWINDIFLKNVYINKYDAETIAQMTCAGIRGQDANTVTYARTPLDNAKLLNLEYNLANGNYLLKGWPTFRVNGTTMSSGEILSTPGDYTVEYMLNGEPVASRTVSLYKLGDTNLDGDAFVAGDSVYEDAYTTVGMIKYGAVTRASVLAADLNNDDALTDADSALFMAVKADVSKVDSIVGMNYGDSIGFNYEGGKNVMPIGGYYGPANTADISDATYQLIKDSGINLITYLPTKWGSGNNRDVLRSLALAEKYGIGVYLTDNSTNVLTKDGNGNVTAQSTVSTASELANAMAQYGIYDSVVGLEVIGEPKPSTGGTLDADNYKRYKYYDDLLGTLQSYANVSGGYVIQGAGAFQPGEYTLVDEVEPDVDYLAFDSYLYLEEDNTIKGYKRNAYFETLDTMRTKSIDNSKPFWSYVSAGCDFRDDGTNETTGYYCTEADILWNVNTSLAFGAKGITYFPLIQPSYFANEGEGNDYDRNGIIGADGNANRYYTMVQRANTQIAAIDEVLMNADSKGVIAVGNAASDITTAASQRSYTFEGILSRNGGNYTNKLSNVASSTNAGAMVGAFDYHSSEAYYVVNYDTTEDATQTVTLTFSNAQDVTVIQNGVKTTSNSVTSLVLTLDSGEGALVVLEDYNDVVINVASGNYTLYEAATVNGVARAAEYQILSCGVYTVQYASGTTENVVIYKIGDINADNNIDVRDFIRLKKYIAGTDTLNKSGINALNGMNQPGPANQLAALTIMLLGI